MAFAVENSSISREELSSSLDGFQRRCLQTSISKIIRNRFHYS